MKNEEGQTACNESAKRNARKPNPKLITEPSEEGQIDFFGSRSLHAKLEWHIVSAC